MRGGQRGKYKKLDFQVQYQNRHCAWNKIFYGLGSSLKTLREANEILIKRASHERRHRSGLLTSADAVS